MLDPDEYAEYEAWREKKLRDQMDLSINAFNTEQSALAGAYDAGVRAGFAGTIIRQSKDDVIAQNPYRQPGMTAAPAKRVTS